MLEVGAFHPSWGDIHLGPKNALEAHALLGGGPFLPIHWGTFSLALHAWDEPVETLLELGAAKSARLVMPRLGEPVEPSQGGSGHAVVALGRCAGPRRRSRRARDDDAQVHAVAGRLSAAAGRAMVRYEGRYA